MTDITDRRRLAAAILSVVLSVIALALAGQLPLYLGILVYTEQFLSILLGLALGICFLTRPIARLGRAGRLFDALAAGAGVLVGCYLAYRYPELSQEYYLNRAEAVAIGIFLIPLTMEALRRVTGPALAGITLLFMVYAMVADLVPGRLQGREMTPADMLSFVTVDSVAIFGIPLTIAGTVVVAFIVFGQFLQQTGGAVWFTDLAAAAVGRYRGGAAKIAVVASGLFGSISGSAVANVASTGILTIPMMKKAGFPAHRAAAYEAVASTGGQIAPPIMGAAAFLMAMFLEIPYADVVAAAAIPAALFYFSVLMAADFDAARHGTLGVPADQVPRLSVVMKKGWYFPLPFAALVFLLFAWNMGPAESALWSLALLIVVVTLFGDWRFNLKNILGALAGGGRASVDIILVGAAAGMIIGIMENTGLSFGLTYLLVGLAEGELWLLLVTTALICIVLGLGMPTTGIYILVATLAGPPLIELGIEPIAAHMFVLYFGLMSMISPPVAIAAFTAAAIAGAAPMKTAFSAMRIGWIAFILPFIFIANPALLMQGGWRGTVFATLATALGIWAVGAGLSGYLLNRLGGVARGVSLAGGALMLASQMGAENVVAMFAAGAGLFAGLYLLERRKA